MSFAQFHIMSSQNFSHMSFALFHMSFNNFSHVSFALFRMKFHNFSHLSFKFFAYANLKYFAYDSHTLGMWWCSGLERQRFRKRQ
jgi:hypothetical protein